MYYTITSEYKLEENFLNILKKIRKNIFFAFSFIFIVSEIFIIYYKFDKYQYLILNNVSKEIQNIIEENEALLEYIGGVIISSKEVDVNFIYSLIKDTPKLKYRRMKSSYISWANPSGTITVSGKSGVIEEEFKNITHRDYLIDAKKEPWELKFSKIDKSLNSTKLVIPTILGVSKKNENVGYLVFGLNHDELINIINSSVDNKCFDYYAYVNGNLIIKPIENDFLYDVTEYKKLYEKYLYVNKKNISKYNCDVFVCVSYGSFLSWMIVDLFYFFLCYCLLTFLFIFKIKVSEFTSSFYSILSGTKSDEHFKPMFFFNGLLNSLKIYKKTIDKKLCIIETINKNLKFLSCSLKEKDDYFSNFKINLNSSLDNIIEELEINSFSNNQMICNIRNIQSHHWNSNQESVFNVNTVIDECVDYHMNIIVDMGIVIKKNLKNVDLFVRGNRESIKNKILSMISCSISSSIQNGEIHFKSHSNPTPSGNVVRILIRYKSAVNMEILNDTSKLYSQAINEYRKTVEDIIRSTQNNSKINFNHNYFDNKYGEFTIELYELNLETKDNVIPFSLGN